MVVFVVSWLVYDLPKDRKVFLLLASYFFYATLDLKFLPILIAFPSCNFILGRLLQHQKDQGRNGYGVVFFGVTANLTLLGVFKYFDFFAINLTNFLQTFGLLSMSYKAPVFDLVLPLGISFFTFQGISYIVDVYRGEMNGRNSLLDVLLFISFFPHLVAGPIVRAKEFIPQLAKPVNPDEIDAPRSLSLIVFGLFKKIVIANYLATLLVDPYFDSPQSFGLLDASLAVLGYAVQIYCDFSAYSDMAIGIAGLLGYQFPENFNQPYRAKSLQEFWRRWHISLSSWLRDYLFISLGGSKLSRLKTYRNLGLTMLLGGLWHGASWNFFFWGGLHGSALALERWWRERNPVRTDFYSRALQTVGTFTFVCFCWIFFRAPDFETSFKVLQSFFSWRPIQFATPFVMVLLFVGMSLHFFSISWLDRVEDWFLRIPKPLYALLFGLLLFLIAAVSPDGVAPFIYFRF